MVGHDQGVREGALDGGQALFVSKVPAVKQQVKLRVTGSTTSEMVM